MALASVGHAAVAIRGRPKCLFGSLDLTGPSDIPRYQKLNVVGCQQLAAHALVQRPSTIITINELQNFVEIITLSISVSVAATVVATAFSLRSGRLSRLLLFAGGGRLLF